jgi:hypothetical protein
VRLQCCLELHLRRQAEQQVHQRAVQVRHPDLHEVLEHVQRGNGFASQPLPDEQMPDALQRRLNRLQRRQGRIDGRRGDLPDISAHPRREHGQINRSDHVVGEVPEQPRPERGIAADLLALGVE